MLDFNKIKKNNKSFVIAEIGHNHQGSLDIALEMIRVAKESGADAVKLQKRDNKSLFTDELYNLTYDNKNSYGITYGEHRERLEFSKNQFKELIKFSNKIGILLFATPFDFKSVELLSSLKMPAYKIASADLTNTPLQEKIAKLKKPIFLSTGGGRLADITRAVKTISKYNKNLCIMHCTAAYPAEISELNLNVITVLKKKYSNYLIGLSDHENGIDAGPLAYMLGARVFEKHFTLNRSWKGTDQSFSLEPNGLKRFIRNIGRVPTMLGSSKKEFLENEKKPIKKMAKSIVAIQNIKKGTILSKKNIGLKSPSGGLAPYFLSKIIGKKAKISFVKDQKIDIKKITK